MARAEFDKPEIAEPLLALARQLSLADRLRLVCQLLWHAVPMFCEPEINLGEGPEAFDFAGTVFGHWNAAPPVDGVRVCIREGRIGDVRVRASKREKEEG